MTRPVPDLKPAGRLKLPRTSERTLGNGLTVIAVRRPAVPLVELRLRIPFGKAHLARGAVLANTLLSGTGTMSNVDIAAELQTVGGGLSVGVDADRLGVVGNALAAGLDRTLEILADVLTGATYPAQEVATERERLADRINMARSQPAHLARVALLKRMYGRHPYAVQTPDPEQVQAVRPAGLRALHADRVRPDRATLVIVGDVSPERALDTAEKALGGWAAGGRTVDLPPAPRLEPGPIVLTDRPGSVQSSIRLALDAVPRDHPDHPVLQLANLVFGGYFSSRLTENIREDKGYTYSPFASIEHSVAGSVLTVTADVANEVTAPALLETWYELGRLALVPPTAAEVEQARQYALGNLRIGTATQNGLANLASSLAGAGLRLDWLAGYSAELTAADRDAVAAAAARYLAPSRAVTVVLGAADAVEQSLAALGPVERTA